MVSALISRLVVLFLGTLYPVYGSYKAIRSRKPKEYISWMMYWICFALFSFVETFSDIFLAFCIPFYYELKIVFLVWLLSPLTNGAVILYKNFLHPRLLRHEQEIDNMITRTKENGVTAMYQLGTRGAQYASQLLATTAIKGQQVLLDQIQRSYSQGDLAIERSNEPDVVEQALIRSRAGRKDARRQVVSAPTFSDDSDGQEDMFFQIDEDEGLIIEEVTAPPPPLTKSTTRTAATTTKKRGTSGARITFPDDSSSDEDIVEEQAGCANVRVNDVRMFSDSESSGSGSSGSEVSEVDPEWRPLTRSKVTRKKPLAKQNDEARQPNKTRF